MWLKLNLAYYSLFLYTFLFLLFLSLIDLDCDVVVVKDAITNPESKVYMQESLIIRMNE